MADVWIREGDTGPSLRVTMLDRDEARVNLAGADVALTLATIRPRVVVLDAVVVDILQDDDDETAFGDIEYLWESGELPHDGYVGFLRATFGDGTIVSYPNDRWMTVAVPPDLVAAAS